MDDELENLIEDRSRQLLNHLAVCIKCGRRLTVGQAMDLIRSHIRNAVLRTQYIMLARQTDGAKAKGNGA